MSAFIVPCVLLAVFGYAFYKKTDISEAFFEGVSEGIAVCRSIFPVLLLMLTLIAMLRSSGAIDAISHFLSPIFAILGLPEDCIPLVLLRPFSGGGALAVGADVIKSCGADSYAGRVAAVMLGASETSFYTIAAYSAFVGMKKTYYAVPAALCADITAFCASAFFVRLFF